VQIFWQKLSFLKSIPAIKKLPKSKKRRKRNKKECPKKSIRKSVRFISDKNSGADRKNAPAYSDRVKTSRFFVLILTCFLFRVFACGAARKALTIFLDIRRTLTLVILGNDMINFVRKTY
jgi:hypothetical protein